MLPKYQLQENDLEALAIGAAILGTGGGGNPYIGKLRARELLRQGKSIEIIDLHDLPADALVVSVGGIGAPVISIEKIEKGDECFRALQALEESVGKPISALIPAEIGGANSIEPLITGALAGLPVVDADGMGRAFPEVQMCTFFIYGHSPQPAALADEKGNRILIKEVIDMFWLERFARTIAVDMGAAAGFALPPMRADFLQTYAVPNTITQALELGQAVLNAQTQRRNPIEVICETQKGLHLFSGKITDVHRELRGGFSVGEVKLEGIDSFKNDSVKIAIQNENLVFWRNEQVEVCVPDLIMVLDLDTGIPITTEMLRFGQRVAVIAMPCHPLLKTVEALKVVGPAAFGYPDIDFQAL